MLRPNKRKFLEQLEELIVKEVVTLMKNTFSDHFEGSCPRVQVGMIYEILCGTLYKPSDTLNYYHVNHLFSLFGRLIDQFEIGKHEHGKQTAPKHSPLSPSQIPWNRINYYARLYASIYNTRVNYIDEIEIKKSNILFKKRTRIKIRNLKREYITDYDKFDAFYNYLDRNRPKMEGMTLPPELKEPLTKSIFTADYVTMINILLQYGKADILGFFDQILNHPLIHKSKNYDRYHLWVHLYSFIYNLALIHIRVSRDTTTRWVISIRENDFSDLFFLYSSINTTVNFSLSLTELHTKLKDDWFYPFIPFFPCVDKKGQKNWIILPFTLKLADASLINSLAHLIFEDSRTQGDFFEEEVQVFLQESQFKVWEKINTKELNKTVRQHIPNKGDVDLVVEGDKHYLLIQCKVNSPRRRKTFTNQALKGKNQLEIVFSTISKKFDSFSHILDPEKDLFGIVLVSTPQPIYLRNNPFQIQILSYDALRIILSESNGSCLTLVENIFKLTKQIGKEMQSFRKKSPWKDIGNFSIQFT